MIYEQLLDADAEWAMSEGSLYFEEGGAVQASLRRIASRLDRLNIPYAIAGGMALFAHGFRRFTEDVDLLVTSESLKLIHQELEGAGYRPPFLGSKNLRDAESGVRIEFLVTGQYPGDGKPKPVAFPSPERVSIERAGIRYLNPPTLIELKLASGMTNPQRGKDLVDVQELIKLLSLPEELALELDPYVQPRFRELWQIAQGSETRFLRLWTSPLLKEVTTLAEMLNTASGEDPMLSAMVMDGVTLERREGMADNQAYLVTTDPAIAHKYDMHEESEFLS